MTTLSKMLLTRGFRTALVSLTGLLLVASSFVTGSTTTPAHAGPATGPIYEITMFRGNLNRYREGLNLSRLAGEDELETAAKWMSQDVYTTCLAGGRMQTPRCGGNPNVHPNVHDDSLGRDIPTRVRALGYPNGAMAEIITLGSPGYRDSWDQALNWFKGSPTHDAIMRDPKWRSVEVSQTCGAQGCVWVAVFGDVDTADRGISKLGKVTVPPATR